MDGGSGAARICKGDILKLNSIRKFLRQRRRLRRDLYQRRYCQKREVIIKECGMLVHRNKRAGYLAQGSGNCGECTNHKYDYARSDRTFRALESDEQVG